MRIARVWEIWDQILRRIEVDGLLGGDLDHIDYQAWRGWAREYAGLIVGTIGEEEIEYASGWIRDREGDVPVSGDLIVFTASRIIRAPFSAPESAGVLALNASVSALRRSAVQRVELLSIESPHDGQDDWPRHARVRLDIGSEVICLPFIERVSFRDPDLGAFIPRLLSSAVQ